MMDWTDRHCRYFLRLIAPHALLYTEMVTTGALLHGDRERYLRHDRAEHPLALQLGGSDPDDLARCAQFGHESGYDEINLNCGCPSDRVQNARFGACLMAEPRRVADCVAAMRAAVPIPVTIKTRLGIDNRDSYEELRSFVDTVAAAGSRVFIVHARKAWLSGLSPKENREIPPLQYESVHRIKRDFPALTVILNGGLSQPAQVEAQLAFVDGVMIGREAYQNPYLLAEFERTIFAADGILDRAGIVHRYRDYVVRQLAAGVPLPRLTRHLLGLYNGLPGARRWRRRLSESVPGDSSARVLDEALACVRHDDPGFEVGDPCATLVTPE